MRSGRTLYFDHQATTPVDEHVLAKMIPYFRNAFGNPHSSDHYLGWQAAQTVEKAAAQVARMIGYSVDEIFFTSGATESNNLALLGLGRRAASSKRRRLLVSAIEHKCVLAVGRVLQEQCGFTVDSIPVDHNGFVDLQVLENMLDEDVLAVSVMAVNNEIGTIQDIKKISRLVSGCGAIFHCDAAQGPIGMDLAEIGRYTDIISLSSHKMYGPKGIGVVAISREFQDKIEPLVYGGGQQHGLRSGTIPVPLCVGMGVAAELFTAADIETRRAELCYRRNTFLEQLTNLSWPIVLNGPLEKSRHPGNANILFDGFAAQDVLSALQPHLAASTGSACTSGIPEPSHVLRAIGLDAGQAQSSVRFSLGFDTSDEDIDEAVALIDQVLKRLSKAGLREC